MRLQFLPLGEVCQVVMGQSPPSVSYNSSGDGLPFFQGKVDFGDIFPSKRFFCTDPSRIAETGDILLSVRAPVGPTNIAREKSCIGRGLAALRTKESLDCEFLFYFLRFFEPNIAGMGRGSTFEAINRDDIENINIPLYSLPEQKRIAGMLAEADRLRRTRRYALELSNTFLPAAFLEMFGDPKRNPMEWPLEYLADVCLRFADGPFGSNLKSLHYRPSGIRVIRLNNIGIGEFLDEDAAFISPEHFKTLRKHECLTGDVLIGTLGDPNLRACIQPPQIKQALNKADCVQARPNPEKISAEYLCTLLNIPSTLHLVPGMVHGQTRARVSMGELADLPIPLPPLAHQRRFGCVVARQEQIRAKDLEALRQAEHLFDSLLHQMFSSNY